jgi:endonuclease/exonuclease/phosphatase family metal-dependent hydrolase
MGKIWRVLRLLFSVLGIWVVGWLAFGTATDWRPQVGEIQSVGNEGAVSSKMPLPDTLRFCIWNIGYCGMGAEVDFFFDKGNAVTSKGAVVIPEKILVDKYQAGYKRFLNQNPVDFFLLQEVDKNSKRSYYTDQVQEGLSTLSTYSGYFGLNFDVKNMPLPIVEPWHMYGKTYGGVATFARFEAQKAERHQLPGDFGWPTRIFQLDRCLLTLRYAAKNGKQLVVVNLHNSAHDGDGALKKLELDYLRAFCLKEYEAGNYVICGGDWNQCPPFFKFDTFIPEKTGKIKQLNIPSEYMPEGWQYLYDPTMPTNRKAHEVYERGRTFETLIDFYMVSPNVKGVRVRGANNGFEFSDHQAVFADIVLN